MEQGRPEGVVQGVSRSLRAPEALRMLRGKSCCAESPVARKVLLRGKSCCAESPAGAEESTGAGEIAGVVNKPYY